MSEKLTPAMENALALAEPSATIGVPQDRLYHAGFGRTGRALYDRGLVGLGGALTRQGMAEREAILARTDRGLA